MSKKITQFLCVGVVAFVGCSGQQLKVQRDIASYVTEPVDVPGSEWVDAISASVPVKVSPHLEQTLMQFKFPELLINQPSWRSLPRWDGAAVSPAHARISVGNDSDFSCSVEKNSEKVKIQHTENGRLNFSAVKPVNCFGAWRPSLANDTLLLDLKVKIPHFEFVSSDLGEIADSRTIFDLRNRLVSNTKWNVGIFREVIQALDKVSGNAIEEKNIQIDVKEGFVKLPLDYSQTDFAVEVRAASGRVMVPLSGVKATAIDARTGLQNWKSDWDHLKNIYERPFSILCQSGAHFVYKSAFPDDKVFQVDQENAIECGVNINKQFAQQASGNISIAYRTISRKKAIEALNTYLEPVEKAKRTEIERLNEQNDKAVKRWNENFISQFSVQTKAYATTKNITFPEDQSYFDESARSGQIFPKYFKSLANLKSVKVKIYPAQSELADSNGDATQKKMAIRFDYQGSYRWRISQLEKYKYLPDFSVAELDPDFIPQIETKQVYVDRGPLEKTIQVCTAQLPLFFEKIKAIQAMSDSLTYGRTINELASFNQETCEIDLKNMTVLNHARGLDLTLKEVRFCAEKKPPVYGADARIDAKAIYRLTRKQATYVGAGGRVQNFETSYGSVDAGLSTDLNHSMAPDHFCAPYAQLEDSNSGDVTRAPIIPYLKDAAFMKQMSRPLADFEDRLLHLPALKLGECSDYDACISYGALRLGVKEKRFLLEKSGTDEKPLAEGVEAAERFYRAFYEGVSY